MYGSNEMMVKGFLGSAPILKTRFAKWTGSWGDLGEFQYQIEKHGKKPIRQLATASR
jgi:hypothetical protein